MGEGPVREGWGRSREGTGFVYPFSERRGEGERGRGGGREKGREREK